MHARDFTRKPSGLRLAWLTSALLATVFLPASLCASSLGDSARQLAHKIAAVSGPGVFALEVSNRSSLDEKSLREVRGALEAELRVAGVHPAKSEQAQGTIDVILSESLREYVWTAEIVAGSTEKTDKKVVLVSLPKSTTGMPLAAALPIVLKTTLLLSQEHPMLDATLVDIGGGSRLLVLEPNAVSIYHHPSANAGGNPIGRWELEVSLPITHARALPRDFRGRLLLRRDHLFDVYLPGAYCRSSAVAPLTLACNDADDPWPLTPEESSVRAFYAAARNFFTGSAFSWHWKNLQRSFLLLGSRASAAELHPLGISRRRWLAASGGWDHGPGSPWRKVKVGKRSGRDSLQLRQRHAIAGLRRRRFRSRQPAGVRDPRSRSGGCQLSGGVRGAGRDRCAVGGNERQ